MFLLCVRDGFLGVSRRVWRMGQNYSTSPRQVAYRRSFIFTQQLHPPCQFLMLPQLDRYSLVDFMKSEVIFLVFAKPASRHILAHTIFRSCYKKISKSVWEIRD